MDRVSDKKFFRYGLPIIFHYTLSEETIQRETMIYELESSAS